MRSVQFTIDPTFLISEELISNRGSFYRRTIPTNSSKTVFFNLPLDLRWNVLASYSFLVLLPDK